MALADSLNTMFREKSISKEEAIAIMVILEVTKLYVIKKSGGDIQ